MDHSFTEFNALLIGNKLSVYLLKHDFEVSCREIMRAQVIICDIGFSGVYVYVQYHVCFVLQAFVYDVSLRLKPFHHWSFLKEEHQIAKQIQLSDLQLMQTL